jgi:hypothetical protein
MKTKSTFTILITTFVTSTFLCADTTNITLTKSLYVTVPPGRRAAMQRRVELLRALEQEKRGPTFPQSPPYTEIYRVSLSSSTNANK